MVLCSSIKHAEHSYNRSHSPHHSRADLASRVTPLLTSTTNTAEPIAAAIMLSSRAVQSTCTHSTSRNAAAAPCAPHSVFSRQVRSPPTPHHTTWVQCQTCAVAYSQLATCYQETLTQLYMLHCRPCSGYHSSSSAAGSQQQHGSSGRWCSYHVH
jgi:hypothetical protein